MGAVVRVPLPGPAASAAERFLRVGDVISAGRQPWGRVKTLRPRQPCQPGCRRGCDPACAARFPEATVTVEVDGRPPLFLRHGDTVAICTDDTSIQGADPA